MEMMKNRNTSEINNDQIALDPSQRIISIEQDNYPIQSVSTFV
jgi:hypothetical protein